MNPPKQLSVKFLADEYCVDTENKSMVSSACNIPAKDYLTILLLHYLIQKSGGIAALAGEWATFKELAGIEGYESAFKKRVIGPIVRKYGKAPDSLFQALDKFKGKAFPGADIGIVLEVLAGVPALIQLWKSDEEFGPEANVLFDANITKIFCTEDIIVLAEIIAHSL